MPDMEVLGAPQSEAAEWSVLSRMLTFNRIIGEVIALPLEKTDFSSTVTRAIYLEIIDRHYSGRTIDPVTVGEALREELGGLFGLPDLNDTVPTFLSRLKEFAAYGDPMEHARIVRKASTLRQLQRVTVEALDAISAGKLEPEEIGDTLATKAVQISAGQQSRAELLSWMDVGREYARHLRRLKMAREQGVEIGVYTGLECIDNFTAGIGPGELAFIGGEPGVGKTALAWAAGLGFAEKQMAKTLPANQRRVNTLFLSMEMNLMGSTARVVATLTGIEGTALREGKITDRQFASVLREWKMRENMPVIWNFASNFRLSQMRALIAQSIRLYNVGFVIIDHFRMIDTDRHYNNPLHADEVKVRFLKENICKDLNVAVVCLAHSTKVGRSDADPKPRLSDLRGSGMIAAFADFVGFVWSKARHMDAESRMEAGLSVNDMDLSWEKNRWGAPGDASFSFEQDTMKVKTNNVGWLPAGYAAA